MFIANNNYVLCVITQNL